MISTVRDLKKRNRRAVNRIKHYNPTHLKYLRFSGLYHHSYEYTFTELLKRVGVDV